MRLWGSEIKIVNMVREKIRLASRKTDQRIKVKRVEVNSLICIARVYASDLDTCHMYTVMYARAQFVLLTSH